jgi:hypothetical protein
MLVTMTGNQQRTGDGDSRRAFVSKPLPGEIAGDDAERLAFVEIAGMRGREREADRQASIAGRVKKKTMIPP